MKMTLLLLLLLFISYTIWMNTCDWGDTAAAAVAAASCNVLEFVKEVEIAIRPSPVELVFGWTIARPRPQPRWPRRWPQRWPPRWPQRRPPRPLAVVDVDVDVQLNAYALASAFNRVWRSLSFPSQCRCCFCAVLTHWISVFSLVWSRWCWIFTTHCYWWRWSTHELMVFLSWWWYTPVINRRSDIECLLAQCLSRFFIAFASPL